MACYSFGFVDLKQVVVWPQSVGAGAVSSGPSRLVQPSSVAAPSGIAPVSPLSKNAVTCRENPTHSIVSGTFYKMKFERVQERFVCNKNEKRWSLKGPYMIIVYNLFTKCVCGPRRVDLEPFHLTKFNKLF